MRQSNVEWAGFDAVVVAYYSAAYLEACLIGLIAAGAAHVTVIDNSNEDASRAIVQQVASATVVPLVYHGSTNNLGYGAGANLGFRLGGPSDWVVFLSPDVAISRSLAPLLCDAERHKGAAIAGLLRPADPRDAVNVRPRFTVPRELLRAAVGGRRSYRLTLPVDGEDQKVAQLDGCFLAMRKSTFIELGGFDERFELYFEDVDFCERISTLGGCWIQPREFGRHVGGASRDRAPVAAYLAFRVSRIRYLRKWVPHVGWAAACAIGLLEFLTRSALRAPEGDAVRLRALSIQLAELRTPGSQWVLSDRRPSGDPVDGGR